MRVDISFLSAVKNEEQHVTQMISSILDDADSSGVSAEILFCDDHSDDETLSVLNRVAEQDGRVRIVDTPDTSGKNACYNAAFMQSRGKLIAFLAGDDTIPKGSLKPRVSDFTTPDTKGLTVSFAKLKTFSDDPKYDAMLIPRGKGVSKSGAALTMTRGLAEHIFPLPLELPNEDTWVSFLAEHLADQVLLRDRVVANYRIHSGNSHKRDVSFEQHNEFLTPRAEVWRLISESHSEIFPPEATLEAQRRWELERLRRKGDIWRIFTYRHSSLPERLALLSHTKPLFYYLRSSLERYVAGRGQR